MPPKRKIPSLGLERRVRARKEEKWEPEPDSEAESSGSEVSEEGVDGRESDEEDGSAPSDDESQSGSEVMPPPNTYRLMPLLTRPLVRIG